MDSADYANDTREELILHAVEILIAVRQGRGGTAVFTELAERFARVFLAFDDWLLRGGEPPDEWTRE